MNRNVWYWTFTATYLCYIGKRVFGQYRLINVARAFGIRQNRYYGHFLRHFRDFFGNFREFPIFVWEFSWGFFPKIIDGNTGIQENCLLHLTFLFTPFIATSSTSALLRMRQWCGLILLSCSAYVDRWVYLTSLSTLLSVLMLQYFLLITRLPFNFELLKKFVSEIIIMKVNNYKCNSFYIALKYS